mgnify:CR=1 FL=1
MCHYSVGCPYRWEANLLRYITVHQLRQILARAQIQPREFTAVDVPHLGLEATTKLPRYRQIAQHFLHRLAPSLLETNRHRGTRHSSTDRTGIADATGKRAGYLGNDIVPCLYLEFLAHGQEDRFRSHVTLCHKLRGAILFHRLLLSFRLVARHHQESCRTTMLDAVSKV